MDKNSKFESNKLLIEEAKRKLLQLVTEPEGLKRTLKAIAIITQLFEAFGIRPILVGGQAVEIYTFGSYTTKDVDLVLSGFNLAGEILVATGFEPKTPGHSHWYHSELELPIEIPDDSLFGSENRVTELDVDGAIVYVIGIEDLILDRLRAGVYWKSTSDMEWAKYLLESYFDDIDAEYLESESKKPQNDVFETFLKLVSEIRATR
ncbi:hypothetical protein [Alicyclobacillus sp. SO9]|uniref:hypothetical protein n=1 Tax=Alicyclobacillus sp. SO9 TaxID=2665646 RepID=UPI0018E6FBA5|nr:hypothetical protein [Alicyclobacillus sp. SO9]QQE79172.1 hypothetical protein GI364_01240 [Alicyclobacillus sp. SO9]